MHLTPVRLSEIPLTKRMSAARIAAKECRTPDEISEVMAAALWPSEKTYWIRAEAVIEAQAA